MKKNSLEVPYIFGLACLILTICLIHSVEKTMEQADKVLIETKNAVQYVESQ